MKLYRLLIYDGDMEMLEIHLSQRFVKGPFPRFSPGSGITLHEEILGRYTPFFTRLRIAWAVLRGVA